MRTMRKKKPTIQVRGEVVMRKLNSVTNNPWNPNTMSDEMKASLLHGLRKDGWLASQSLLIWGTDDKGKQQNLIIDGEHRWKAAVEDGLKRGPMVFLDGISSSEAKALTIKMNQKRGEWDVDLLAGVVKELELEGEDLVLELGLGEDFVTQLLGEQSSEEPTAPTEPATSGKEAMRSASENVKLTHLSFDADEHAEFMRGIKKLARRWGTENVAATSLRAVRELTSKK